MATSTSSLRRVIIFDSDDIFSSDLVEVLADAGFEVFRAGNRQAVRQIITEKKALVLLLGMSQFREHALEDLCWVKSRFPCVEVIILNTRYQFRAAFSAINRGAFDFLVKSENMLVYIPVIDKALKKAAQQLGRKFSSVSPAAPPSHNADRDILAAESCYRTLFEQARDAIFLLEPVPGGIPSIMDANAAAHRSHGYVRDELFGKPVSFLDADTQEPLPEKRPHWAQVAGGAVFEARQRRKDGSVFDAEVSVKVMHLGEKRFYFYISRDITKKKRYLEQLELAIFLKCPISGK